MAVVHIVRFKTAVQNTIGDVTHMLSMFFSVIHGKSMHKATECACELQVG